MIPERLERFQDFGKLEAGAFGCGRPFVHRCAMRNINAAEPRLRTCRGLAERCLRRNHRLQERQRHGYARASKKCAAGKALLCNEHKRAPLELEFFHHKDTKTQSLCVFVPLW